MTNTAHPLPAHWIVEQGFLKTFLKMTADEFAALQSRLSPFWTAPGALAVHTEFDPDEFPIGSVWVEYEGMDLVVSKLFLVMVGIHDDINADRISNEEPEDEWRQTSCHNCEADVEGVVGGDDWRDRGGNTSCPSGERHVPNL